jgi:hypothetical protein
MPASFLPGDSLLLLAGALIAKGVMDFVPTIAILTFQKQGREHNQIYNAHNMRVRQCGKIMLPQRGDNLLNPVSGKRAAACLLFTWRQPAAARRRADC